MRQTNVEKFESFELFLHIAEEESKDKIITGDHNCNILSADENTQTKKLKNITSCACINEIKILLHQQE